MTFNIHYDTGLDGPHPNNWASRRARVVESIRLGAPDIAGLQEPLPHQVADLQTDLGADHEIIAASRTDDRLGGGEHMVILFRRACFVLLDHGSFWLSETPAIPGSIGWDASAPRLALWTLLRPVVPGIHTDVLVCCTHLDHLGAEARLHGATLVRRHTAALAQGVPVIIMGDFNAESHEAPHAAMTDPRDSISPPLCDVTHAPPCALNARRPTFRGFTGYGDDGRPRPAVIDFIFHDPRLVPEGYEVIEQRHNGCYPSDHLPAVATLRFPSVSRPAFVQNPTSPVTPRSLHP
jgi:endonuclease/exonuclease/phosphatase family metal-dependent hydrolase